MSVHLLGPLKGRDEEILTPPALDFIADLERTFGSRRRRLMAERRHCQEQYDAGAVPVFRSDTSDIRSGDWLVEPPPKDLRNRRVELTGPADRKMMINGLNSGASTFMADFEDSASPAWRNMIEGQINLLDAVRRTISYQSPDGRSYALDDEIAVLMVRPRGWHLAERHVEVDGKPVSAGLLDFGLYVFHNARELLDQGSGPYFYLPKLESHLEARLWNDVFVHAQQALGIPTGSIRATVLIETLPAAFVMDEILYELREHSAGLNAGRWDYIFSTIKRLRTHRHRILPDRGQVTMTVPFMRAYTELLVKTCHRRGAHAIGGMAAFIPSRTDPEANRAALARVREDKIREATDGFDGTWVAHPDLVPVAREVFDDVLGEGPNQVHRLRDDVHVTEQDLLDTRVPGGTITEEGLRTNVRVAILYIESWLRGTGAAALFNLMEDTATAEISRSQVWQWVQHAAHLDDGREISELLVWRIIDEELTAMRDALGEERFEGGRFGDARRLFEKVALCEGFIEFLTVPGYGLID
jgi:malate synthase